MHCHSIRAVSAALLSPDLKVIEVRNRIGFRPNPDLSRFGEGRGIYHVEHFAVQINREEIARRRHTQRVPLTGMHSRLFTVRAPIAFDRQVFALAVPHFVEHDVVFERVGAHDEVVVFVAVTPD